MRGFAIFWNISKMVFRLYGTSLCQSIVKIYNVCFSQCFALILFVSNLCLNNFITSLEMWYLCYWICFTKCLSRLINYTCNSVFHVLSYGFIVNRLIESYLAYTCLNSARVIFWRPKKSFIRIHCIHDVHRCGQQPIATDVIHLSICLCVGHTGKPVHKWLNRSRYCLEGWQCEGSRNHFYIGVKIG